MIITENQNKKESHLYAHLYIKELPRANVSKYWQYKEMLEQHLYYTYIEKHMPTRRDKISSKTNSTNNEWAS